MAKDYSAGMKETLHRTSADDPVLLLVEIDHADLVTPIRVVNDVDIYPYGSAYAWQAATVVALNAPGYPAVDSSGMAGYNGFYYVATTGGTTGATEPAWTTTIGATVNDGTVVWTCTGYAFMACGYRYTLPDDMEQGNARARIAIDNVGRELVQWLELSSGGEGASMRFMQVRPSVPDLIEWETTMELSNVQQNAMEVSGQLGYENLLKRPAISAVYDYATAPGIF